MNEENISAVNEEVAEPQTDLQPEENGTEGNAEHEEVVTPQIDNMSDDDFIDYLNNVRSGNVPRDNAQQTSGDAPQNDADNTAEEIDAAQDENVVNSRENADNQNNHEPFKIFATQEDWQRTIDGIVGERLKSSRQSKEQLDSILQQAAAFYDTDDMTGLADRLIEDLRSQNADRRGIDIESYKRQQQTELELRQFKEHQQQEREKQEQIQQIQARWARESEELKRVIPNFDFDTAMKNPKFYDAVINNGQSLGIAYMMSNQTPTPAPKPKQTRRPIIQNGNAAGASGGTVEFNPETASDADFERYINRIRNNR